MGKKYHSAESLVTLIRMLQAILDRDGDMPAYYYQGEFGIVYTPVIVRMTENDTGENNDTAPRGVVIDY